MTKRQEVIQYIKDYIKKNNLKYGDKLISETLLAEELNLNRGTVRIAFADLEKEGIIEREHGRGTFVALKNNEKKYILIVSTAYSTKGDIKKPYRFFFKILNKYIIDRNYTPLYFIANETVDIKTSIEANKGEIAGVVSLNAEMSDLEYIASNNIPIVDVLRISPTPYPCVSLDFCYFHNEIMNMIGETKNVLLFSLDFAKSYVQSLYDCYPYYLENYVFGNYSLNRISYAKSEDKGEEEIVNILDSIKEKPDLIVFLDDNLFKLTSEYFKDYSHIFQNTPIITQSHVNWSYNGEYNITRLEFDFYEVGKVSLELLESIIRNKPIIEHNKIIKPKLIPSQYP